MKIGDVYEYNKNGRTSNKIKILEINNHLGKLTVEIYYPNGDIAIWDNLYEKEEDITVYGYTKKL